MPVNSGISPARAFFVESYNVAGLANFDVAVTVNFQEVTKPDHAEHPFTISTVGRNEGCEHDHSSSHEEIGDFAHTADAFDELLLPLPELR